MSPTRAGRSSRWSTTMSPVLIVGAMEPDITVANGGQTRRNASPANATNMTATTRNQRQLTFAVRGRGEAHRAARIRARGNPSEGSARSVVGCSTAKGGWVRGAGRAGGPAPRQRLVGAVDRRDERREVRRRGVVRGAQEGARQVVAGRRRHADAIDGIAGEGVPVDAG